VTGPLLVSRHPLHLAPLLVLWLAPTMTVNLVAFSCVATLHVVIGSVHEERRLRASYGRPALLHKATSYSACQALGKGSRIPLQET
jgi:hypothetical protein